LSAVPETPAQWQGLSRLGQHNFDESPDGSFELDTNTAISEYNL
jgi:hypothetical protein